MKNILAVVSTMGMVPFSAHAKDASEAADTAVNNAKVPRESGLQLPHLAVHGLLVSKYDYSLTNHVDASGNYYESQGGVSSFSTKHAFITFASQITKNIDANVMVDLADMQKTPTLRKIIDFAYIHYNVSPGLQVMFGQFRPFTNAENRIAPQVIRTFDYTLGYYLAASMGWEGFQPGVAVYGQVPGCGTLLNCYVGLSNGNGTANYDNNNNKDAYIRLQSDLNKHISIGVNGGIGKGGALAPKNGFMAGADFNSDFQLSDNVEMSVLAAYREGANWIDYAASAAPVSISQYRYRNFYVFPQFRFGIGDGTGVVKSFDFTVRYEYLNRNVKLNSNPESAITPLIGISFLKNYAATINVGMSINRFKVQDHANSLMNNNQMVMQCQVAL